MKRLLVPFGQPCRVAAFSALLAVSGCASIVDTPTVPTETSTPPSREDVAATPESGTSTALASKPTVKPAFEPKFFKGTGVFVNPKPEQQKSDQGNNVSLNFEGADIREVAKTVLADILNESYIVDPKVSGTISLRTVRPLPKEALLTTLETLLKMNGASIVKENGIYKILPNNTLKGSISPRQGGKLSGYSVQIIPLQYVGAREMAKILEPFVAEGGIIRIDDVRNMLIVGGLQNEIAHIMDTVETFDVDWLSGMSVGLFTLQSADVKSVAVELDKILGEKSVGPLAGIIKMIPIERLNGFIIITTQPKYLDQAKLWIERLDRAGGTAAGEKIFVYQVQNGKAENLANLISQAFGGPAIATSQPKTNTASLAPGLTPTTINSSAQAGGAVTSASSGSTGAKGVRVIPDKDNNALLIVSDAGTYEIIEQALRKLDAPTRQVLIDVTIAEVTLTDDLKYGIDWTFMNGDRRTGTLDAGVTGIGPITPGFSYVLRTAAAGEGAIRTIQAALNMNATDSRVNVLSSPHIMVADNQQAKIQVGNSVPTPGQTLVSGTGPSITSTQYLDTGIILTVTPRISAGGVVNLDVQQEVSDASTATGATAPTISKRTVKSIVTVQSGETTILGGLIKEDKGFSTDGIPLLSQIPVIGALFGSQGYKKAKTELVVLITPRIASNVSQAKAITEEFRKKLGGVEEMMLGLQKEKEVMDARR